MSNEPESPSPANGEPNVATTALVSTGEPDTLPLTYCRKCESEVKPYGKGKCPRCHTFLRLNFYPRKHPVNVLRRDAILADLLVQFPPANVVQRAARGQLAAALERLETTKPGTTEWVRLSGVVKELSDDLCPPTPTVTSPELPGIEDMPQSALERAEALLALLVAGDTLSERQLGQLDVLREAMRGAVTLPPDPVALLSSRDVESTDEPNVSATRAAGPPSEPSATLAPAPCTYGCGTLARCAELKATRLDAWRALHFLDPDEVARRDKEATAEMLFMLGKPSPFL
jgi:hypothetical protein